jgi:hypothetical protein
VLVDHRIYRTKPGMTSAQLDLFAEKGFAAQTRHLGQPMAYLFADSGDLNTIVQLWAYEDEADRAHRRAAMQADPEWKSYIGLSREASYLVHQSSSLMIPAAFAPLKR